MECGDRLLGGGSFGVLLSVTGIGMAQVPSSNSELKAIAERDQADRGDSLLPWGDIAKRDTERQAKVREMLARGEFKTSDDYIHAALVFQHGSSIEDARLAVGLANVAQALPIAPGAEESSKSVSWFAAATWDRLLLRLKQPQWYGTQYVPSADGNLWVLYDFKADVVSAEERQRLQLMPVTEIEQSFPRKRRSDQ